MSASPRPVGFVTGLRREARIIQRAFGDDVASACSGADPACAAMAATRLIDGGVRRLFSVGYAGGLDPELRTGAVVMAAEVIDPGGTRHRLDTAWHDGANAQLHDKMAVRIGVMAGRDRAVASVAEKKELFRRTGALAVDMESHAVAEIAVARGISFSVLRVVLDGPTASVPEWLAEAVTPDGGTDWRVLVGCLCRNPASLPALIGLGRAERQAASALFEALRVLCGVLAHEPGIP